MGYPMSIFPHPQEKLALDGMAEPKGQQDWVCVKSGGVQKGVVSLKGFREKLTPRRAPKSNQQVNSDRSETIAIKAPPSGSDFLDLSPHVRTGVWCSRGETGRPSCLGPA